METEVFFIIFRNNMNLKIHRSRYVELGIQIAFVLTLEPLIFNDWYGFYYLEWINYIYCDRLLESFRVCPDKIDIKSFTFSLIEYLQEQIQLLLKYKALVHFLATLHTCFSHQCDL